MGSLLRNREFRQYLLGVCVLGLIGMSLCFWVDGIAGAVAAGLFGAMLAASILFTRARYRKIAQLSDLLAKIAAGDYAVSIREYAEGELSILASEILKITGTLSHQAESLERDKTFLADSLADISHQLKTPLTSVSMMTELLLGPNLEEEKRQEFLAGIQQGLNRIQWLIVSLLKLSRLDAGAVRFQSLPIGMPELIGLVASPMRTPMEMKSQTLFVEGGDGITFAGDKHWLAEAVGNLLKNCVEHAPEGGQIKISCSQNALYAMIVVSDNGPGIDGKDLPRIFDRFYRGKKSGADSVGIGLALSKSIIQNQGGTITAGNMPEGGARFTVKLYGKTVV